MTFVARKEDDGLTVLQVMRRVIGLSQGMIRRIKYLDDGILLNSERVTVRRIVREGDTLVLNTSDDGLDSGIEGFDLPIDIVYEDEDIVVPDKPPHMPTHPSHNHHNDTVANALAYRYRCCEEQFVFRPVNRLDRNTSGLLIIARNRISAARLHKSMLGGEIRKKYIAVLEGTLDLDVGEIDTYMRRTAESIIVREVCEAEAGADRAITKYRVLARAGKYTVVLAEPITGRTHQLRVHFASLGAAIAGDDLYGAESEYIDRHALHSALISFPHPTKEKKMVLFSPIPDDIAGLLRKISPEKDIKNEIEDRIREIYGGK